MPPIDDSFHLPATSGARRSPPRGVFSCSLAILVSGGFYVASGHPIHLPLRRRGLHRQTSHPLPSPQRMSPFPPSPRPERLRANAAADDAID
jgi:hypothetical protein